ncbi:VCBS repeat-containing protein [bacterium]|nr:MAG: VCBS repeat-containing protein [bacterium]
MTRRMARVLGRASYFFKKIAGIIRSSLLRWRWFSRLYLFIHKHLAHKPHTYMMSRSKRYVRWHSWSYRGIHHKHVHWGIVVLWTVVAVLVVLQFAKPANAFSTWNQTDWSGGQGSSTSNQFQSINNITSSTSGQLTLPDSEKLSNNGFESNMGDWKFTPSSASLASKVDYSTQTNPQSARLSDIDNDGDSDAVVPNYGSSTVSVFKNNGNGTFVAKVDYSAGWGVADLQTGDIDSDGDKDIVAANYSGSSISVFKNNGNGTFVAKVDYSAGSTPSQISLVDVDGDTDLDVVLTNNNGGTISVFKNNGDGTYAARVAYSAGSNSYGLATGDIDGDGDIDAVNTKYTSTTIGVHKNNGDGTFAAMVSYTNGSTGSYFVDVADIDADNDLDVITTNEGNNTASVFKNNGDGTFAAKVDYPVASGVREVEVVNIDGDEHPDLIVANYLSDNLHIRRNNGDGTFGNTATFTAGDGAYGVGAADLDSDGDIDIAVSNYNASTISIFSNTTDGATRSTTQAYNGSTGAAKAITTGGVGTLYQQYNVGNTNSYTLEAYVYTNGTAVTSADASLYVGSSAVSTTYTATSTPGWYKLTATVAGVAASQKYGVQVTAGKTIYIDNVFLYEFTSGTLTSNVFDLGYGGDWDTLTYTTDKPSFTTVKVRTSNDPGMSGAPAFTGCTGIASGADLTGQSCVSNDHRYVQYQVTLNVDNGTTPTLQDVAIQYDPWDIDPPVTNASNLSMKRVAGGSNVASNAWTNGVSPYFEWDSGTDNSGGSGIQGYCLYLGQDNTANPVTTKGLLGASPINTDGDCQFAVSTTNVDLATSGYLQTALTSSNSPYYLSIRAIDNAGNVYAGALAQFSFRFDNTPPNNPSFISAPSQFVASKNVTLTWPTSGGDAPNDTNSGLEGLQYKIGNTTWYGDGHTGSQDNSDLLANDGSYTTTDPPDYANLSEGNNVVYFRTWDEAGNVSATSVTTVIKINTISPSSPQNVSATPASNTTNSFAFSWAAPSSYQGSAGNLTYCYSINTIPTNTSCTFTAGGVTSLPAGAYATQPGDNTFYVVAKDEAGNINYATAASVTFTANTSAPGMPLNVDIADVSIKTSGTWRLALSWNEPTDIGAGIGSYRIYRSTDNNNFSQVATTTGTSHVDGGLSSQKYYYRIKACDSANNCGANSATVDDTPTGKFTEPANITSQPVLLDITSKKAKVRWSTDRASDSKISIGTKSGEYDPFQVASNAQVTDHAVSLNNLTAGTTYYAKASWTDEDGNTGLSSEFSFKTQPAPSTQDISVIRVGLSSAQIRFTSVSAARVVVQYGKSASFGGVKEIATSLSESTYEIELVGLDDGTKYDYRLNTYDADGNEYQGSTVLNFTTPARPRILNLGYQSMDGEPTSTQQVSWTTNVPTTSLVRYTPKDGYQKEISDSKLTTEHTVIIHDLIDDTEYSLVAESRDAGGNLAVSDVQRLKTALDTRPPKISRMKVETAIRGTGAEARGQIVVSWYTDEPATSQIAYGEGSGRKQFTSRTSEDAALSNEHIVIISDLSTSHIYSVQPLSKDRAGNETSGDVRSAVIGKASDSVIAIVLNALKGIFGY